MFLKDIRLTNFKCHESLYMDFESGSGDGESSVRKTTFLVGENGTGKTALLQAIALVTAGSEALRSMPGIPDNFIQVKKRYCQIDATIATAQGEERTLSLRLERGQTIAKAVANAKTGLAAMDAALRHTERSYFTGGFGSGRRLSSGATAIRPEKVSARYAAVRSLFNAEVQLRPLDSIAAEIKSAGGSAGVNALRDALNTFLPLEVRFKGYLRGTLQFETPDGPLALSQLSNGYQQTVAWVSELLSHLTHTFGDYKNPMAARGLLLIDEIDLHLHPAWQRHIHAFLTQGLPNMQVIATTYSPLTAQQAGRDELYALRRNEQNTIELVPFIGDPSWMLLHQLLMSPIFGLQTDESVKAETEKSAKRTAALSGKGGATSGKAVKGKDTAADPGNGAMFGMTLTGAAAAGTDGLPEEAPKISINTRVNSTTATEDIALLKQINKALKGGSENSSNTTA